MNERELQGLFPEITNAQIELLRAFSIAFLDWNDKVNLISRKDTDEIYERHILHSLLLAKVAPFNRFDSVLDVGTGGGFPGLPLAIVYPEVEFILVDSIAKKIRVVQDIVLKLGLKNVRVIRARVESLNVKVDAVVSRAVTQFPVFVDWVSPLIKRGEHCGIYYLKGGDLSKELQKFSNRVVLTPLSKFSHSPFFETKKVVHLPFN